MAMIFQEADIVSLHIPLTTETDHLVNRDFIHRFKKNFYLINTSRGRIVNTDDLVAGMKEGKVAGACLDVLEYESKSFQLQNGSGIPPAYDYLSKSEKVILSPHIAGWTWESWYKLSAVLADKIEAAFHA
jgi:D-3-phosphoglycerate dehydrogenase